jgi:hypothetical protein
MPATTSSTAVRSRDVAHGGGDSDTILGGGADDQLYGDDGDDGDDVLDGQDGNDSIFGSIGTDRCAGGAGTDTCDGGTPGSPTPTPDDPDVCDDTVETKINCRGDATHLWNGTAAGTLTYGGITETWKATSGMDLWLDGGATKIYSGDAALDWKISGSTPDGCTYAGGAKLTGTAQVTLFGAANEYAHEIRSPLEYVTVQVSCPVTGTSTEQVRPLNADAASTQALAQPDPPTSPLTLSGDRTYATTGGAQADWFWTVTGR